MSANGVRQTDEVHDLIRDAASGFLRGESSVVDFTYAFRNAMNVVTADRPLEGHEVLIFHALEQWETSGWSGRPALVDYLRELAASAIDEAVGDSPA
jgi:hypothetical protein